MSNKSVSSGDQEQMRAEYTNKNMWNSEEETEGSCSLAADNESDCEMAYSQEMAKDSQEHVGYMPDSPVSPHSPRNPFESRTTHTGSGINNNKMDDALSLGMADNASGKKICRVCGDKALSVNFNVVTCESCKAFFRRNALKPKAFRCPFNANCDINVVSRKFCKKCRLRKCFEVGMIKEWIMSDDARIKKRQLIDSNRVKRRSIIINTAVKQSMREMDQDALMEDKDDFTIKGDDSESYRFAIERSIPGAEKVDYDTTQDDDSLCIPKNAFVDLVARCRCPCRRNEAEVADVVAAAIRKYGNVGDGQCNKREVHSGTSRMEQAKIGRDKIRTDLSTNEQLATKITASVIQRCAAYADTEGCNASSETGKVTGQCACQICQSTKSGPGSMVSAVPMTGPLCTTYGMNNSLASVMKLAQATAETNLSPQEPILSYLAPSFGQFCHAMEYPVISIDPSNFKSSLSFALNADASPWADGPADMNRSIQARYMLQQQQQQQHQQQQQARLGDQKTQPTSTASSHTTSAFSCSLPLIHEDAQSRQAPGNATRPNVIKSNIPLDKEDLAALGAFSDKQPVALTPVMLAKMNALLNAKTLLDDIMKIDDSIYRLRTEQPAVAMGIAGHSTNRDANEQAIQLISLVRVMCQKILGLEVIHEADRSTLLESNWLKVLILLDALRHDAIRGKHRRNGGDSWEKFAGTFSHIFREDICVTLMVFAVSLLDADDGTNLSEHNVVSDAQQFYISTLQRYLEYVCGDKDQSILSNILKHIQTLRVDQGRFAAGIIQSLMLDHTSIYQKRSLEPQLTG